MEQKIQKTFVDMGFGFPLHLINVPMIKIRGHWTPRIDYNKLTIVVLRAIANKMGRLSGAEVRFVRQHFGLTLQMFAKRLGVSHVAVIKWEKSGQHITAMSWSTEKDIRLFVLSKLTPSSAEMFRLYGALEQVPPAKAHKLEVPADKLAA